MYSLINSHFFIRNRIKKYLKIILGVKENMRGPKEVELVLGEYVESRKFWRLNSIGSDTRLVFCEGLNERFLKRIIEIKNRNFPNLKIAVHHGFSSLNEIKDKTLFEHIDLILVPSKWVKDLFISQMESLSHKIQVLPMPCFVRSMIDDSRNGNSKVLIYDKSKGFTPEPDFSQIIERIIFLCQKNNLDFQLIKYGEYLHTEYRKSLSNSKFLVYLSLQETQGLALMHAWEMDVPTLIFDRGIASWDDIHCQGSSAPYYSLEVGEKFSSIEDLDDAFSRINSNTYTPREYYAANFDKKLIFNRFDKIVSETLKM